MTRRKIFLTLVMVLGIWTFPGSTPAVAAEPDITGQWYGYGSVQDLGGGTISFIFDVASAMTSIPGFGLFNQPLPVTIEEGTAETTVTIGVPGFEFSGVLDGDSIAGSFYVVLPGGPVFIGDWWAEKYTGEGLLPGEDPGPVCEDLPPRYCNGSAEYCSDLVPFLPESGPGYLNQQLNGEGFVRRDLMQLVKYVTAKVKCKAADWDYGNSSPLGLGDMSEADGSIPGTSIGSPGHPPGTHEDGKDMDIAYYQLYAPDNRLRPVGVHMVGFLQDAFHLVGPPYSLDVWRTALNIAYLSEHPRVRVIGVDGEIGPILEDAFDALVEFEWIDSDLRDSIPLAYEVEDTGLGWFYYHHHHMHISMNPVVDMVSSAELKPETLNRRSRGRYVTAHVELDECLDATQIDTGTVALILDGHTMLYAEPGRSRISDYNDNGVADLTVKFDRQAVLESIDNGTVEISITGLAYASFFQESDTIRVRDDDSDSGSDEDSDSDSGSDSDSDSDSH